jgi:hypothetical protein
MRRKPDPRLASIRIKQTPGALNLQEENVNGSPPGERHAQIIALNLLPAAIGLETLIVRARPIMR